MTSTASYERVLDRYPSAQEWLQLLGNLGRASATLEAYGRGLAHYLLYCETAGLEAESVTFEQVTLYIRRLLPGQNHAVANSTLHQRLTASVCGTTTWSSRVCVRTTRCRADNIRICSKSPHIQDWSGAWCPA